VRRRKLPDNGCVICGCHGKLDINILIFLGCNPEDMRKSIRESREREPSSTKDDG